MSRPLIRRYRNIFLIGLPGVGKSTFGQAYAVHSSRTFADLDRVIESEQGRTVAQLFSEKMGGESGFREIEHHALQKFAKKQNGVVALGGGAPCSGEAIRILKAHGLVVFLRGPMDEMAQRIFAQREKRPLFAGTQSPEDVREKLEQLLEQRYEWYSQAHVTLDLRFSSLDAAKIELASFEHRAFRNSYVHDLQQIGDELPDVPELQVHAKPRYVLRERPYLASLTDGSGNRGKSGPGRSKKSGGAGKAKRPRAPKMPGGTAASEASGAPAPGLRPGSGSSGGPSKSARPQSQGRRKSAGDRSGDRGGERAGDRGGERAPRPTKARPSEGPA